ncbi:MAG: tripartite tricarboxylate transporter permease [Pseudomonadota bacterium]
MLEGIQLGLNTAFSWQNILYLLTGCIAGTFIGLLPGLGPMTAIALMIPIAASLEPSSGIIMMAAVYYGAIFGGSTSAILINAPGVASTVATSFDGYPMAKKGLAGKALTVAALASFTGGIIAAALLLISGPTLAELSLSFQSSDYFALMIFALVCIAAFTTQSSFIKALLMALVGLMLSTVGTDQTQGVPRFTFGHTDLLDGISFLLVVMATFALSEALLNIMKKSPANPNTDRISEMRISQAELKDVALPVTRSSFLGFFVGLLPGTGATIASLLAYGGEQRVAKTRAEFGTGSIRGLAAPEAANNAAATGSFVPMLSLGIPGSGTTAIMLGALIAYGVQPGPMLYVAEPEIFWSVIVSMWLGNIVLLMLNLPLIPYIARLLLLPQHILMPLVLFFSLIGVYMVSFNAFDLRLMVLFAASAVILRILTFPMAPLILGFILGGMIEENLARALLIHDGSWSFLWERPITLVLCLLTLLALLVPVMKGRGTPSSTRKRLN